MGLILKSSNKYNDDASKELLVRAGDKIKISKMHDGELYEVEGTLEILQDSMRNSVLTSIEDYDSKDLFDKDDEEIEVTVAPDELIPPGEIAVIRLRNIEND